MGEEADEEGEGREEDRGESRGDPLLGPVEDAVGDGEGEEGVEQPEPALEGGKKPVGEGNVRDEEVQALGAGVEQIGQAGGGARWMGGRRGCRHDCP